MIAMPLSCVLLTSATLLACAGGLGFPPHPGPFGIGSGSFTFTNPCGSDQTVNLFYPTGSAPQPFPVAVYAHGSGGSIPGDFAGGPASLGMVVIAVNGQVCSGGWQDMAYAVIASEKNQSLHPQLKNVDWSRIGTFGHSEGGVNAMSFAVWPREQGPKLPAAVQAVVASHGCANVCAEKVECPIMYTSGSGDRKASRKCYPAFSDSLHAPSKVWASVSGAHHMSPMSSGNLNPYTADFLGCHLKAYNYIASCGRVYGNATDAMCHNAGINLDGCETIENNPTPPPTLPPPPSPTPTHAPTLPGQCELEQNVDFDSGSQSGKHDASSKEDCCQLCAKDKNCAAAVYRDGCWFKTSDQISKKVPRAGAIACVPKTAEAAVDVIPAQCHQGVPQPEGCTCGPPGTTDPNWQCEKGTRCVMYGRRGVCKADVDAIPTKCHQGVPQPEGCTCGPPGTSDPNWQCEKGTRCVMYGRRGVCKAEVDAIPTQCHQGVPQPVDCTCSPGTTDPNWQCENGTRCVMYGRRSVCKSAGEAIPVQIVV